MSRKKLIILGMVAGSIVGGYLPAQLGFDGLMVSLLGSLTGGIIGIWIGYKFSG
jgi:phage tail tape-measure protein